ncbi:aryl-sulfate sulfohydrolase [Oceaniferula spumae]|uniref:Aryl-sulfate sulfohydrolase n=1 Tax=Oceaniferula spumae TaxID=2979115 RepID=A0AAT9FGI2_9BACT
MQLFKVISVPTVIIILGLLTGAAHADKKPNILFILADDLGSAGLHCTGEENLETPVLDTLAKQSRRFELALSPYPTCKPARAAILSGQYGPRTGVYRVVDRHTGEEDKIRYTVPENGNLPLETKTIAHCLQSVGYRTAMFGKWHVANDKNGHPTKYGFDEAISSTGHYTAKFAPERNLPKGKIAADLLTDEALTFIDKAHKDEKPFFLYMPYYLVHKPLEARADYIKHFRAKFGADTTDQQVTVAAMTKMLDDCVGRLLGKLDDLKIRDNTLVVFSSDNGSFEPLYNGRLRGVKGETYEGGMRVPYFFHLPGKIEPGLDSKNRVNGIDLFPTLLDATGAKKPMQSLDGTSLWPILSGKENQLDQRKLFCYYPKYARFNKNTKKWKMSWRNVVYEGHYKLIHYPEYDSWEMFDLKADPTEKVNIAKQKPEQFVALKKSLATWLTEVGAPAMQENPNFKLAE